MKLSAARSLRQVAVAAAVGAAALAPVAAAADTGTDPDEPTPETTALQDGATSIESEDGTEDDPEQTDEGQDETGDPGETDGTGQTPGQIEQLDEELEIADEDDVEEQPLDEGDEGDEVDEEESPGLEELIMPDYGYGKDSQPVRIGVDLADGTYVPAGTTTVGSVLRIVETGPNVEGGSKTTECTTEAGTEEGTATFCVFDNPPPDNSFPIPLAARASVEPEPADSPDEQVYLASFDSTVTISHVSVPSGLVAGDEDAVLESCSEPTTPFDACTRQVALLSVTGLPPVAADDNASTDAATPVTIDVLANDDPVAGAPIESFDVSSAPDDGTATVTGPADDPTVEYTPDAGFSGTDTFAYAFSTPNGTATAQVTVSVSGDLEPVAETPRDAGSGDAVEATSSLPDAGGFDRSLLAWAAGLLAAGAGALVLGRRAAGTE